MDLTSVADLIDALSKLIPQTSPQFVFAGAVLAAVAAAAHAWGVYRGATAARPDAGVRLDPPELKQ